MEIILTMKMIILKKIQLVLEKKSKSYSKKLINKKKEAWNLLRRKMV